MFIGVDIGGTFTDLVKSENGQLTIYKLLSTPENPAEAMLAGLQTLQMRPDARISHGSTVATNAILERKGARTALITTAGFRDVLAIGRQNRPVLYALHPQIPPPLIPRQWRYEVPERLDVQGNVLVPLDIAALDHIIAQLAVEKIEAVAVCFLYSFVNPTHERMVRDRLLQSGLFEAWQISLSSDVLPEFREYERTSTVALDAYVRPIMNHYLQHLENQLPPESRLLVMKSDGGVLSSAKIREQAIQTALSGPAAGVIGAFHLANLAGFDQIITLDIGGTSTDVALCPGEPIRRTEAEIDGLPLKTRLIDIETVGAGGGSIARLDAGGALRVGPESAGAMPGPIIYGRGGQQVTVSDANAVLGRLDADHFLGGQMTLHLEPALKAIDYLSKAALLSRTDLALGIIDVANSNIDRALRRVSIARGYDPRDFTLVAFGGAGALHACDVADRLEMRRVLIPHYPGVLCALGLLVADIVRDYSRTILQIVHLETEAQLEHQFKALIQQAKSDLAAEVQDAEKMIFNHMVDMRYQGQSFELTLPFTPQLIDSFHYAHEKRYGYRISERPVEIVTLRLQAVGITEKPMFTAEPLQNSDGSEALIGTKTAHFLEGERQIALYEREDLVPGAAFNGACLIFQFDSTSFVPPDWSLRVDAYRNLILEKLT